MKCILLFIVCYFTNLMEVYHIQGCLKEQRTKKWWEGKFSHIVDKNAKPLERNSWIPCLIAHAFEWCFLSILPLAIYGYAKFSFDNQIFWWWFIGVFTANTVIHYVIDVFKTHYEKINWSVDQGLHCIQIIAMVSLLGRF